MHDQHERAQLRALFAQIGKQLPAVHAQAQALFPQPILPSADPQSVREGITTSASILPAADVKAGPIALSPSAEQTIPPLPDEPERGADEDAAAERSVPSASASAAPETSTPPLASAAPQVAWQPQAALPSPAIMPMATGGVVQPATQDAFEVAPGSLEERIVQTIAGSGGFGFEYARAAQNYDPADLAETLGATPTAITEALSNLERTENAAAERTKGEAKFKAATTAKESQAIQAAANDRTIEAKARTESVLPKGNWKPVKDQAGFIEQVAKLDRFVPLNVSIQPQAEPSVEQLNQIGEALATAKNASVRLPPNIIIGQGGKGIWSDAAKDAYSRRSGGGHASLHYKAGIGDAELYLPPDLVDPEEALRRYATGESSTPDPLHTLMHELGHNAHVGSGNRDDVVRADSDESYEILAENKDAIAREVGQHATHNPKEMVAEVYAGLMMGAAYSPVVMEAYKSVGGKVPYVPSERKGTQEAIPSEQRWNRIVGPQVKMAQGGSVGPAPQPMATGGNASYQPSAITSPLTGIAEGIGSVASSVDDALGISEKRKQLQTWMETRYGKTTTYGGMAFGQAATWAASAAATAMTGTPIMLPMGSGLLTGVAATVGIGEATRAAQAAMPMMRKAMGAFSGTQAEPKATGGDVGAAEAGSTTGEGVSTLLMPKEAVIAPEVAQENKPILEAMNAGQLAPGMADGGNVPAPASGAAVGEVASTTPGPDDVDKEPRMLKEGSFVVRAAEAQKPENQRILAAMQSGQASAPVAEEAAPVPMKRGGSVGKKPAAPADDMYALATQTLKTLGYDDASSRVKQLKAMGTTFTSAEEVIAAAVMGHKPIAPAVSMESPAIMPAAAPAIPAPATDAPAAPAPTAAPAAASSDRATLPSVTASDEPAMSQPAMPSGSTEHDGPITTMDLPSEQSAAPAATSPSSILGKESGSLSEALEGSERRNAGSFLGREMPRFQPAAVNTPMTAMFAATEIPAQPSPILSPMASGSTPGTSSPSAPGMSPESAPTVPNANAETSRSRPDGVNAAWLMDESAGLPPMKSTEVPSAAPTPAAQPTAASVSAPGASSPTSSTPTPTAAPASAEPIPMAEEVPFALPAPEEAAAPKPAANLGTLLQAITPLMSKQGMPSLPNPFSWGSGGQGSNYSVADLHRAIYGKSLPSPKPVAPSKAGSGPGIMSMFGGAGNDGAMMKTALGAASKAFPEFAPMAGMMGGGGKGSGPSSGGKGGGIGDAILPAAMMAATVAFPELAPLMGEAGGASALGGEAGGLGKIIPQMMGGGEAGGIGKMLPQMMGGGSGGGKGEPGSLASLMGGVGGGAPSWLPTSNPFSWGDAESADPQGGGGTAGGNSGNGQAGKIDALTRAIEELIAVMKNDGGDDAPANSAASGPASPFGGGGHGGGKHGGRRPLGTMADGIPPPWLSTVMRNTGR